PGVERLSVDNAAKAAEEARMSRVERMAALGQLAAGVAHEVNNPLTFLTGNLEFLHKSLSDGPVGDDDREPLLEVLAEAQEGLGRIAVIVRDLKTFVREVEDPVADPCDVHQVVRSVVRLTDKQVRRRAS
ncbi:MAG: hypothetical protein KC731_11470, partial [Myxococcales bacterium]|nr:hypothetical protein [Myxococcales bacterium]